MDLFSFPDSRNRERFWSLFPGKVSEFFRSSLSCQSWLRPLCMQGFCLHNNQLFNTFYVAVNSAQGYPVDLLGCFIYRTHQHVHNCHCSSGRRVQKLYENKLPFAAHWRLPAHLLDIFNVHKPPPPFTSCEKVLHAAANFKCMHSLSKRWSYIGML